MSDQQTSNAENTNPPPPTHRNPLARAIAHLNLTQLTLLVLAVIFVWQWLDSKQQTAQMQQLLAQRLSDMDGSNKATQALSRDSQEQIRELGGKLGLLEGKFAETQNQRSALETLYHDLSSSRDQMLLAEIEQLLLIATQQLQISANIKSALIALQQADTRLQRQNRPAFSQLRASIGRDIEKLRSLPDADITGINTRLDNLIVQIDRFPLLNDLLLDQSSKDEEQTSPPKSWTGIFSEFLQDLARLVRIENMEKKELPLISHEQSYYLRENLKLRLLAARLELLSRDDTGFRRDIRYSQEWLKSYFDTKSPAVVQALTSLQKLNSSSIRIEIPDISHSIEAVRHYRESRERVSK